MSTLEMEGGGGGGEGVGQVPKTKLCTETNC